MPTVTIVKPNNTPEQEKELLRHTAFIMEQIYEEEYGIKVKIELVRKKQDVK